MHAGHLTRRFVLLLPLVAAACGGDDEQVFEPLRYNDLPPIQVNVAAIAIEQRFVPSGVAPDVSNRDPAPPVDALKAMANDRLQAFGTANKAVFAILDASLTRSGDVVVGSMAVRLTILDDGGAQLGFAEAHVQTRHTGDLGDIRGVLYDMTKSMMNDMNIEFEYQIRHSLRNWLTSDAAPAAPVEQTPLDGTQAPPPPGVSPVPPPDGVSPGMPPDTASPAAAPSAPPGYPPPIYLRPPQ